MNDKIKQTLELYCQNELNDFCKSELFSAIEKAAKQRNYILKCEVGKAVDSRKNDETYLSVNVFDVNNKIVEIWDDGPLSISILLLSIDKKERVEFFSWADEDFIDSLNWILECLKN